jgi:flagellar biogenesis protein FliO
MFKRHFPGVESSRQTPVRDGLGALLGRFMPAWSGRRTVGALEHLGSLPLTAQSSLALIRLHDETLLLGITPQNIKVLARRPADSALGATESPAARREREAR